MCLVCLSNSVNLICKNQIGTFQSELSTGTPEFTCRPCITTGVVSCPDVDVHLRQENCKVNTGVSALDAGKYLQLSSADMDGGVISCKHRTTAVFHHFGLTRPALSLASSPPFLSSCSSGVLSHRSPPRCILSSYLPLCLLFPPPHMSVCSKLEQHLNRGSET